MLIRRLSIHLLAGCGLAALAGAALADPPSRVGRVSDVEGAVSFLPPGESDWVDALDNYPVTSGESFWTGDSGRLELQLGSVQARVDSETSSMWWTSTTAIPVSRSRRGRWISGCGASPKAG